MKYEPELGQAMFGQPYKEYDVPGYVYAALSRIREEVIRVEWNNRQKEFDPFGNTGDEKYKTDVFEVEPYRWWDDDDGQPYNFKWKNLEISWYKYLGRGMSMNRSTTPNEIAKMLNECIKSILNNEKSLSE